MLRSSRMFSLSTLAFAVLLLSISASANSVSVSTSLSSNNLGISGSIGTVTLTQSVVGQVTVNIVMNPGYTIKLNGADIAFNSTIPLTLGSIGTVTATSGLNTYTGMSFGGLKSPQNISAFGVFGFDYTQLQGTPHKGVTADTLTFTITATGLKLSNLAGGVGLHFCVASSKGCSATGFAAGTIPTPPSAVPEPGTLSMLGTGLLGLAGLIRRRYRA